MTLLDELNALTTHRDPKDGTDCIRANDLRRIIERYTAATPASTVAKHMPTTEDIRELISAVAKHLEPRGLNPSEALPEFNAWLLDHDLRRDLARDAAVTAAVTEDEREALREQMHVGYKALLDSGMSMDEVSWTDYLLDQAIAAKRATAPAPETEELPFGWDGTWRTQGQDAEEGRRVLMTWTKKQLVDGYIQMWQSDIQRESFGVTLLSAQVKTLREMLDQSRKAASDAEGLSTDEPTRAELEEALEAWRANGKQMHAVLLDIWRSLDEDRKHMTFGLDPERVAKEFFAGTWLAPVSEEAATALVADAKSWLARLDGDSHWARSPERREAWDHERRIIRDLLAGYHRPAPRVEDPAAPKTEWSA